MRKKIVFVDFSNIGKTELDKKYSNVIDLDSAKYDYDNTSVQHLSLEKSKGHARPTNVKWPNNYISAIKKVILNYDIVLVEVFEDIIIEY